MVKLLKIIIKSIGNPLTEQERELLHKIENYILNPVALDDYMHCVKNNSNENWYSARAKLVRNIILGNLINKQGYKEVYQYGNLEIFVDHLYKEIYAVKNNKGRYTFNVDERKKEWLDRELKINTYKVAKVG